MLLELEEWSLAAFFRKTLVYFDDVIVRAHALAVECARVTLYYEVSGITFFFSYGQIPIKFSIAASWKWNDMIGENPVHIFSLAWAIISEKKSDKTLDFYSITAWKQQLPQWMSFWKRQKGRCMCFLNLRRQHEYVARESTWKTAKNFCAGSLKIVIIFLINSIIIKLSIIVLIWRYYIFKMKKIIHHYNKN